MEKNMNWGDARKKKKKKDEEQKGEEGVICRKLNLELWNRSVVLRI